MQEQEKQKSGNFSSPSALAVRHGGILTSASKWRVTQSSGAYVRFDPARGGKRGSRSGAALNKSAHYIEKNDSPEKRDLGVED